MPDVHEVDNLVGPAPVPIEQSLAECLRHMRTLAADAGTDDYDETWSREVLDRRPLIVVGVATDNGTWMWVREPGHDAVLHAEVSQFIQHAELGVEDRALDAITREISCLVKDRFTGQHLFTGSPSPASLAAD